MSQANGSSKRTAKPSELLGPPEAGVAPASTDEQFLDRHRRLQYVKDFVAAKEGIVAAKGLCLSQRVLELIKLTAWRWNRDYAAGDKGHPLGVKQLAEMLASDERRVGEAVRQLERDHLVKVRSRIIFLVDDPSLERGSEKAEKSNIPRDVRGNPSPNLRFLALDYFQTANPRRFQLYQKIDEKWRKAARLRRKLLEAAEDAYLAAHPEMANQAEASEPDPRDVPGNSEPQEPRDVPGKNPAPSRGTEPPILIGFKKAKQLASYKERIEHTVGESGLFIHGLPLTDRTLSNVAELLVDIPDERLDIVFRIFEGECRIVAVRRDNRPKSWGMLLRLMTDSIKESSKRKAESLPLHSPAAQVDTRPDPEFQRLRKEQEAIAADPDHPEHEMVCRILGREPMRRPPSAKEHAKAQEAGRG